MQRQSDWPYANELEERVGRPLSPEMWGLLEEERRLEDVSVGAATLDELAAYVKRLLKAASTSVSPSLNSLRTTTANEDGGLGGEEDEILSREVSLTVILWNEASRKPEVQSLRRGLLGGRFLEPHEIHTWIEHQAETDGPSTKWLNGIAVDEEVELTRSSDGKIDVKPPISVNKASRVTADSLKFFTNGIDGDLSYVTVANGGRLGTLRELCLSLERQHGWHVAQSVSFVLANLMPIIDSVTGEVVLRSSFTALTRIQLTVDPTLSPKEVSEEYRTLREQVMGTRYRSLTEKHLALAVFKNGIGEVTSWREAMEHWNETALRSEWRYPTKKNSEKNFSRDCNRALQRVLQPKFNVGGTTGG